MSSAPIRHHPLTGPARQMCKDKGFVALDPDNVDGWDNDNGLDLTPQDSLDFLSWLSAQAHSMGLGVGLKNDVEQVEDVAGDFDFFVNE